MVKERTVMALGLQTESSGGGDFAPILKYDARSGRMFRVDRTQGASGWETNNVEVTNGFAFVPDLDNLLVGWALFAAGVAPQFAMVPLGQPLPAKPSDQYKQGFKMMVKLGQAAGGDLREFASCAKVVIGAMDKLHTEFEQGKTANPGKLPVVAMTGSTAVTSTGQGKSSTNYAPTFAIQKWVDRPAELGGVGKSEPAVQSPPPPPAPVKELAMADGEEF
jgi:hypothetical protein